MDLCLIFLTSWPPLPGLWILTGEPLMLTKTPVLPTDLLTGPFGPARLGGLTGGGAFGMFPSFRAMRTGREPGVLAWDEGGKAEGDTFPTGLFTCDRPPSTNPLPLNGMMFRMSCDPETEETVDALAGFPFCAALLSVALPSFLAFFLPFVPYPSGSLTLVYVPPHVLLCSSHQGSREDGARFMALFTKPK